MRKIVGITMNDQTLARLDKWRLEQGDMPRSRFIEEMIKENLPAMEKAA